LEPAVGDADLVIETIPEDPALKADLFARLGGLCRPDTILTSNSSTLVSGDFATQLANPERFAFLHFYVPHTAVEIMPTRHTDENTITALETFAVRLGEVPLRLNRESPGYVVGAMLGAAVDVALDLLARGIADVETIDRGFMLIIGTKVGPLGSLDIIGLDTSLRIRRERMKLAPDDGRLKAGIDLLAAKVARGELGVKSGRGFYSYPNPTYAAPGFLRALPADRTAGGDRVG
jgi:3-hydroxybutyryl-CoA dehydrogenase